MKLSLLSLLPLVLSVQHVYAEEPQTTKQFLDQANAYLGRGEYNLALQSYDAAIGKKKFLSSLEIFAWQTQKMTMQLELTSLLCT